MILQILPVLYLFIFVHPNVPPSQEEGTKDCFNVLDIEPMMRSNGIIHRSVHRGATLGGHYLHFTRSTPVMHRSGLRKVRC